MSDVEHEHVAEWDAAYVLGALSPSDRRVFEAHLETCEICRASVAEVVPVVGLMARVDSARARSLLDDPEPPVVRPDAALREAVVRRGVVERRRRRRLRWGMFALAAALVVVAAVAVPLAVSRTTNPVQSVALEDVAGIPLTATVGLDQVGWGTRLDLDCAYGGDSDGSPPGGWPYTLVVTAVDGTTSEVSSWRAGPGTTAHLSAGTALDIGQIATIEIRSLTTGQTLMTADVAAAR